MSSSNKLKGSLNLKKLKRLVVVVEIKGRESSCLLDARLDDLSKKFCLTALKLPEMLSRNRVIDEPVVAYLKKKNVKSPNFLFNGNNFRS